MMWNAPSKRIAVLLYLSLSRYEIESSRHTRSHEHAVSMKPFPNRTGVFQRIRLSITSELSSGY